MKQSYGYTWLMTNEVVDCWFASAHHECIEANRSISCTVLVSNPIYQSIESPDGQLDRLAWPCDRSSEATMEDAAADLRGRLIIHWLVGYKVLCSLFSACPYNNWLFIINTWPICLSYRVSWFLCPNLQPVATWTLITYVREKYRESINGVVCIYS